MSAHRLPLATFCQLRELLQQMSQKVGNSAVFVTEQLLHEGNTSQAEQKPFVLLISPSFSALLEGLAAVGALEKSVKSSKRNALEAEAIAIPAIEPVPLLEVSLSFDPQAIAPFLKQLLRKIGKQATLYAPLKQAQTLLSPNDPALQSEFTLQLATVLASASSATPASDAVPIHPAFLQPFEAALLQQIEQERLMNKMLTQIRQSLELPTILQAAVEQVQQLLKVDRVVIYQLTSEAARLVYQPSSPAPFVHKSGFIAYEAKASEAIPSVLNLSEACAFFQNATDRSLYRQGYTMAVEDVEQHYAHTPCLVEFLQQAQVRAKLIAPILVHDQVWGLLIAHHCQQPRRWQDREQKFLQQIAEHLAVAIAQAELYAQVQQQKQTLEQRVIERTQELHDALQAAQTANRAKSEFLAAVSHELRTPLTCVIGMSSTLIRWAKESLEERQQRFLQIIHDSGEHLLELINDILDLSQLEAGKASLNLSEFSLSHMAQQCLRAFQEKAMQSKVDLLLDLQVDSQRDRFIADPQRVRQILLNLLSNAIKFTPPEGEVILRVAASDNVATFQVKDTGIGIPEQQQSLLFQKFQQLDGSYRRQYEGTGLGLALTKHLVELHGGWVEVESTEGVGSVFTVRLPNPQVEATTGTLATNPSEILPGRIVLVEGQDESANIICDILNAAGYQVIWMLEAAMAITQIEILQPVVVITDVRMFDREGYNLIRNLKQNPLTKKLKVLALLPVDTDENQDLSRSAGADDWVTKPIHPQTLLDKVIQLTSKS